LTVFLIDLESVSTRYTGQWKTHIPKLLEKEGHNVHVITGPTDIPDATTPGAFLNFGGTNIYKASQVEAMARLFTQGEVKSGDHFIFTDAWHPGIVNLRYMSELLNIPVTTHGLWHAGSYDPEDFLGRLIGDKPWVRHAEKSFFFCYDHNYFATDFHIKMFAKNLFGVEDNGTNPYVTRTGWPMEYMDELLTPYKNLKKRDLILFPHRIAPEKQVDLFRSLATQLPQYEFVVCQDQQLSKHEYHTLLGEAKIVFSANLQETLGISCYEGAVVGAIPMVPDRLSYKEMYYSEFKYDSVFTENLKMFERNRPYLVKRVMWYMSNYDSLLPLLKQQTEELTKNFFSATNLLSNIK
jgi:hypothetical protein